MFELSLQQEALNAIKETYIWYEVQREGLGGELLNELEKSYEKLSEHPQHYSYFSNKYRRIKVYRFPYFLVYEIENNVVIINSFRHTKRKRNDE